MDRTALEALQMHGQDIPWLLRHWAEHKPDHPVLVWEPTDGDARRWTYAELLAEVEGLAVGLGERGVSPGDKVLVHADNCPEMVLAWLACATVGAVAVTTNTRSVASEIAWFVEKTSCVAAITQVELLDRVRDAGAALKWIAVIGGDGAGDEIPFDALRGDAAAWPGRAI